MSPLVVRYISLIQLGISKKISFELQRDYLVIGRYLHTEAQAIFLLVFFYIDSERSSIKMAPLPLSRLNCQRIRQRKCSSNKKNSMKETPHNARKYASLLRVAHS